MLREFIFIIALGLSLYSFLKWDSTLSEERQNHGAVIAAVERAIATEHGLPSVKKAKLPTVKPIHLEIGYVNQEDQWAYSCTDKMLTLTSPTVFFRTIAESTAKHVTPTISLIGWTCTINGDNAIVYTKQNIQCN